MCDIALLKVPMRCYCRIFHMYINIYHVIICLLYTPTPTRPPLLSAPNVYFEIKSESFNFSNTFCKINVQRKFE